MRQTARRRPRAKAKRPQRPATKAIGAKRAIPAISKQAKTPRTRTLGHPPLDRARRVLSDDERLELAAATSRADRHDDLRAELRLHVESSPILTAGDLDARWQDAYAVGDETPGGANPTPDQDRVDDIGKALGIEYADGQELQGGEEVLERDRHRWEFDPASSEDWPGKDDK